MDGVTITLTEVQVRTLYAILMRVGGSPTNSARMHADAILKGLREWEAASDKLLGKAPEYDLIEPNRSSLGFAEYREPELADLVSPAVRVVSTQVAADEAAALDSILALMKGRPR